MRRLTCIILTFAMALSMFTLTGFAEQTKTTDNADDFTVQSEDTAELPALTRDEAADITAQCTFFTDQRPKTIPESAYDRKYTSHWDFEARKHPYFGMTAPEGNKIHSLYICFGTLPRQYEIQALVGEEWVKIADGELRFNHVAYRFDKGYQSVRVYLTSDKKDGMRINEVFAFEEGEFPDFVQQWQPTWDKADIMFFPTHPDDELLFFGGGIPTYVNRGYKVVVVYFTFSNTTRSSELLNSCWHMGLRNYPVMGTFRDKYVKEGEDPYKESAGQNGERKINQWGTMLYRKYKPEVVVTHDLKGEYGHRQHRMVSRLALDSYYNAADPEKYPESAEEYGTWQVKKLYRHLWKENQITMDWNVPLENLGGKTGLELATEGFEFHKTQHNGTYTMETTGVKYDNTQFGLVESTVGEDVNKNDFMENIPENPLPSLTSD